MKPWDEQKYNDFYAETVRDFIQCIEEQNIPLDTPLRSHFRIEGKTDKEVHILTSDNYKNYQTTIGEYDPEPYKYKKEEQENDYIFIPFNKYPFR